MYLFNYILNVIYFPIFKHTSCGKHLVSRYGVREADAIGVNAFTVYVDLLVFIKDALEDFWHHERFHMPNIVAECFALQIWDTGYIDVLRHPDIFSQNWEVLQEVYYQLCVGGDLLAGQ